MRVLPALLVLALAAPALADPPAGAIMKAEPPGRSAIPPEMIKACVQNYQLRVERLGQLGQRLKLTPQQQKLFETWRKIMVDLTHASPCPPPPTGLSVPTPQRLANQISMLSITLEGLRKEKPAADALYAALTPEQRAVFDGPVSDAH